MFFEKKDEIKILEQQVAALDQRLETIRAKSKIVAAKIVKQEAHVKARLADEGGDIDEAGFGKTASLREQAKALSEAADDVEQSRAAAAVEARRPAQ